MRYPAMLHWTSRCYCHGYDNSLLGTIFHVLTHGVCIRDIPGDLGKYQGYCCSGQEREWEPWHWLCLINRLLSSNGIFFNKLLKFAQQFRYIYISIVHKIIRTGVNTLWLNSFNVKRTACQWVKRASWSTYIVEMGILCGFESLKQKPWKWAAKVFHFHITNAIKSNLEVASWASGEYHGWP